MSRPRTPLHLMLILLSVTVAACSGGSGGGGGSDDSFIVGECGTPLDGGGLENAARQILEDARRAGDIDGYSLEIGTADAQAACISGGDIASRNTPVLIASAGKPVSASVILSLANDPDGLQLDEKIATYLGDTPAGNTEAAQRVTLRQLLNHISGLQPDPACLDNGADSNTTLMQCATEILQAGTGFTPDTQGSDFAYGAGSYQVAGAVAEAFSGETWQTLVDTRIGAPLNVEFPFFPLDNPRIAGGILTTTADLAAFHRAVLTRDPRLLSATSYESFRTSQTSTDGGRLPGVTASDYAFGFWLEDPQELAGRAGPELSSPGLFGTVPWIDDDRGYYGVLLLPQSLSQSKYETGLALMRKLRAEALMRLPGDS